MTDLGCSLIFVQDVMSSLSENIKTVVNIKDRNTGQLVMEEGILREIDFRLDHFPFSYAGRQVFGFGIGKYADHLKMKRTNAELDIDIPSGSKNSSVNLELSNGFNKGLKVDTDGLNLNSKVKTKVNAGSGVADVDLTLAKKSADLELPVKTNLTEAGTLNGIAGAKAADMDVPKVKQISGDSATTAVSGVKPGDVEAPKVNKEQILRNIEESRLARESSGFKDFATRERYLEKVFNKLTPEERELIFNISKNAPKVEYQPDYSFDSVLSMSKNNRPNVEYVYTPEYIKAHKQQFENGAIKFQKFTPEEGGYNNGAVGNEKDHVAFVMPKEAGETLIKVTKGDPELLEDILGLHRGDLGSSPVAIEIPPESIKNPRIPSGNEDSAFDGFWKPGGQPFPGNMPEAVIDEVPWGEFTIRKLGGD